MNKQSELRNLAERRKLDDQAGLSRRYKQVGDFHQGIYDTWGLVSPLTKSACNYEASVMVVAQDWISETAIKKISNPLGRGYDPRLPTNKNLQFLLKEYFNLDFSDVYATNLFVFVKPGNISGKIPISDLLYSAKKYTLSEVEIIQPRIIICLGSLTYKSLCKAINIDPPVFKTSIENPIKYKNSLIFGVPHTGGRGMANAGGLEKVKEIWSKFANIYY